MGGNISSHFQLCRRLQEFLSALIILLKFMQIRALSSKFCRSSSSNTCISVRQGRAGGVPWYTCVYTVQCTASCIQYILIALPELVSVLEVQESIPWNRFREPMQPQPAFVSLLRSPGIDFQPSGIYSLESIPGSLNVYKNGLRAQICKPFKEPRNRFSALREGTTNLFDVPARQDTQAGGIDSLELIPGLLKRLQIRAQVR